MLRPYSFQAIKSLARTIFARDGLRVSTVAPTLTPPVNGKTLARVLADDKPLSADHRTALAAFLAARLEIALSELIEFDTDPFASHRMDLLWLSVGQTFGGDTLASNKFIDRAAALRDAAGSIVLFDRALPDDLCFPPDEYAESPSFKRRRVFLLRSTLAPFTRSRRTFGFGNQDDRDQIIENLIDAVETGGISLCIIDDMASSWRSDSFGPLAASSDVMIFDGRSMIARHRGAPSATLVHAGDDTASRTVVESALAALERMMRHLAHAPTPASVVEWLQAQLSPTSWRIAAQVWRNGGR